MFIKRNKFPLLIQWYKTKYNDKNTITKLFIKNKIKIKLTHI